MSLVKKAISAIGKSNMNALRNCLSEMSKAELQNLASEYHAINATIHMSGSWAEECTGNLIDYDRKIIQRDVKFDRGFRGDIEQYYGSESLHIAAITAIHQNVTVDFDSDYFSSGSMIFGKDYDLGADDANFNADINFEERYIRRDELPDDVDLDECEIDDSEGDIKLSSAFIQAIEIEIELNNKKKLLLPLLEANPNEQWFVFSLLFISSKKAISDIKDHHYDIQEFIENNFS